MRKNNILLILSLGLGLPLYAQSYTLQECKELALKNNFSLESSRLEVMKAEEIKDQAFTKYFPEIKAESFAMQFLNPVINLSIDDISNAGTRDMLNLLYNEYGIALGMDDELSFIESGEMYSISLTQPIFAGGQIVNANKLADLGIKAAQVQSEISERDFLLELEQTYYLSLSLGEKKKALESAINTLDTLKYTVETAKDAGVAMSNDLIKVELKRNELISSRIQLDNAIKLTSKAICQMTGLNYSDSIKFEDSLDPYGIVEEEDPALELKLLDYGIREAKLRKKMEIGKSLPQLGLGVNASFNNILYGNSFNTGIFLSLKIPLSDWWGTSHKIKECNYSVRQAELQRKDLGEKLELQHFQSAGKINECLQILTQKEMAVDLAEENYRLSLLGYEAGTVSISDLLEARSILLQAESEYTDACIQCLIQRKRYAKGL